MQDAQAILPANRLHALMQAAGIGLWEADIPGGSVFCSSTFTRMTGIESGLPFQDFRTRLVAPEYAEQVQAGLAGCIAGSANRHHAVFLLQAGGDESLWGEEYASVTERAESGAPLRVTGLLVDITRIKTTEGALRAENRYRGEVAHLAGLGGWEWDIRNDAMVFDDDCRAMLGFVPEVTAAGPIGEVCANLLHPDDAERVKDHILAYAAKPEGIFFEEMRIRHKGGH